MLIESQKWDLWFLSLPWPRISEIHPPWMSMSMFHSIYDWLIFHCMLSMYFAYQLMNISIILPGYCDSASVAVLQVLTSVHLFSMCTYQWTCRSEDNLVPNLWGMDKLCPIVLCLKNILQKSFWNAMALYQYEEMKPLRDGLRGQEGQRERSGPSSS